MSMPNGFLANFFLTFEMSRHHPTRDVPYRFSHDAPTTIPLADRTHALQLSQSIFFDYLRQWRESPFLWLVVVEPETVYGVVARSFD